MNSCHYCETLFTPDVRHPNSKRCQNKTCTQLYKNVWSRQNPESKKQWITDNWEKRKNSSAKYQRNNKAYYAEYGRLYQAKKQQAKPEWLDEFEELWLLELYDVASRRKLEVDHIVPLTGKAVCGLHVPWNLQLLSRSENAKKSNKFNEDVIMVWEKV